MFRVIDGTYDFRIDNKMQHKKVIKKHEMCVLEQTLNSSDLTLSVMHASSLQYVVVLLAVE